MKSIPIANPDFRLMWTVSQGRPPLSISASSSSVKIGSSIQDISGRLGNNSPSLTESTGWLTMKPTRALVVVTVACVILPVTRNYSQYFLDPDLFSAAFDVGNHSTVSPSPSAFLVADMNETMLSPRPVRFSINISEEQNTDITIPTSTPGSTRPPPIAIPLFANGEWNDNDIRFEVTDAQERLFEMFEDVEGGAKTCPWKRNESHVSHECISLLAPVTQNVRFWYFLGDSTMARPWQWCLVPKLQNRSQVIKKARGTKTKSYLGITKAETLSELKPVNFSRGEGPFYPKRPYTVGCATCENRLIKFTRGGPGTTSRNENHTGSNTNSEHQFGYAEFLAMEYARDVEFATRLQKTTQDSIARYMRHQRNDIGAPRIPKNQTACVISSGMHDLGIPNMTSQVYIHNHIAMKKLLKKAGCDIWIKLELTARGLRSPDVESNEIIFEWNEGIRRSMGPNEYQVNLFARSLNAKHGDKVHMDVDSFYCPLADFFIELMRVAENDSQAF